MSALAIFRRLADANPTVTAYKIEVARCLTYVASTCVGYNGAKARDYALESLSVIRSLPPEQQAQKMRPRLSTRWFLVNTTREQAGWKSPWRTRGGVWQSRRM